LSRRLSIQARKALAEGRVKRIEIEGFGAGERTVELYAVESKDRKRLHIVVPGVFCSCEDFLFSVFYRGRSKACYHMIAVELAIKEGVQLKKERISFNELYVKLLSSLS